VRTRVSFFALALALAACSGTSGGDDSSLKEPAADLNAGGADQLVLRVPRGGGTARVYAYPWRDSLVWAASMQSPAIARIMAFDAEAGAIAFEDSKGTARTIDFRLGVVTPALPTKLTGLRSTDAWNVYGIAKDSVVRITPSENRTEIPPESWHFAPPAPARDLIPQANGSLLILADRRDKTMIWRVYPPETRIVDSAALPHVDQVFRTSLGDRVYFSVDTGIVGVETRTLTLVPSVRLRHPVRSVVTTPSGDRLFVTTLGEDEVRVIDRYQAEVVDRIKMPAPVGDLRMDPLGRTLLVRAALGDTAWAIDIGSGRVVGALQSAWRTDLPTVAPDGAIVVVQESAVALLDPESLARRARIARGASDYWYFFLWSGFRPRSAALDQPVTFASNEPVDSLLGAGSDVALDSALAAQHLAVTDTMEPLPAAPVRGSGFMVQLAALLNAERARTLAQGIRVNGQTARVVPLSVDGTIVHRVLLGPYATRAEAEAVARAAVSQTVGLTYYVFEGPP
jgi:cell division septation protein DedD